MMHIADNLTSKKNGKLFEFENKKLDTYPE